MGALSDLRAAHPKLFGRRVWDELPRGWFDLVDTLCREIESLLNPEPGRLVIKQIKAKYGELRFYYSLEDGSLLVGRIRSLVEAATLRSTTTCEECGALGECSVRGAWVSTLCKLHSGQSARESDVK